MTTKERVFMIDLIKRRFEKKVFLSFISMCFSFVFGILTCVITPGPGSAIIVTFSWLFGLALSITAIMNLVLSRPWSVKKSQMEALKDHKDTDFNFILSSGPLREFLDL